MQNFRLKTAFNPLLLLFLMVFSFSDPDPAGAQERQTLNLRMGGSDIIAPPHPVSRVTIAGPEIADVVVLSPRQVYVYGKETGYTSMILWESGEGKSLIDVVVSLDLTGLKEKLHELYPNEDIQVHGSQSGIVLSGTVSGPEVMEQVIRLAKSYFPKSGKKGGGRAGPGITNLLKVSGNRQIMLEVKFAEINRNSNKDWQAAFGLEELSGDFTGALGTSTLPSVGNAFSNTGFPDFEGAIDGLIQNPSTLLVNFAGNPANVFLQIDHFVSALYFLEGEGLARILAEPRLVTQSGQEASFLAGGEFPVPIAQGDGTISISFKEFGVALTFTPVIMSDGRINLRVAPEVSEIASSSRIPSGIQGSEFVVPNLSTRKLETNVQLYEGQTLALAGLLQQKLRETVGKIPGLGDIPILGSLFRSSQYRQEKTDLLVAVTPHIIKPVKEGSIRFPGENMDPPNRYEFYLEGRLEGRRDGASDMSRHDFPGSASRVGGLEGKFGYQQVTGE